MDTAEQFDIFWEVYPNKKAKQDAFKAFKAALKKVTLQEILDGLDTYKRMKPDWRQWKHPGPWLRAEMWADEYQEEEKKEAANREQMTRQSYIELLQKRNGPRERVEPTEDSKRRVRELMEDFKRGVRA